MINSDSEAKLELFIKSRLRLNFSGPSFHIYYGSTGPPDATLANSSNTSFLFYDQNSYEDQAIISIDDCIPIHSSIDSSVALQLPTVYWALGSFQQIGFELGEVLIVIGDHPFKGIFSLMAKWHGALQVIDFHNTLYNSKDDNHISFEGPSISEIVNKFKAIGINTVFLDFSGKPDLIELLFSQIPQWGRCILAGHYSQPITIDYYNDIHRKGVNVFSIDFDFSQLFNDNTRNQEILLRSLKILMNKNFGQQILSLRL